MAFFVKYIDAKGDRREFRFFARSSAEEKADELMKEEQLTVTVVNHNGKILSTYDPEQITNPSEYKSRVTPSTHKNNTVSMILFIIGIVIIIINGSMGTLIMVSNIWMSNDLLVEKLTQGLMWWLGGIASGMLFIGLAEIIKLLQRLVDSEK